MTMRSTLPRLVTITLLLLCGGCGRNAARAQYDDPNYQQDYSQDNLYHDYAARQAQKEAGAVKA